MKLTLPILLTLLLLSTATFSQQNYPVRTMVQYTPPYSLFLGDFATPKLIVTLTGQDLLDANCPIKLSISLECHNVKVTTKPSYSPPPLYISGGQTIVLTGVDLAQYFDIHNLDFQGITAAKYLQDGQLPEGLYRLNVKVINYKDNKTISNTAFKLFNARMGKPPLLAQPKNQSLIPPSQQTMPIVFSWTPQTIGAFRYVFELWECAVPGIPVETVVSTVRPIDTQTFNTSQFSFHPATVNMKPGTEYAWRVTVEDPHNQQRFSNQGRSEIFTFVYKRKPEEVSGLSYTNRGLKITYNWDMSPAHTKYNFQYFDPQTNHTVDVPCDYNSYTLNIPSRGYHLKVRVQAECYNDPTLLSNYTPYLDTYLEPIPTPDYECGKTFDDREITNKELKHSLAPGEILESKNGDTRFEIISAAEKNGYLSGEFYMIMDCWGGAKIKCEFSDAEVNTDNILLDAEFHNIPDSTLFIKPETIRKEIQEAFLDAATVLTDFSIKDTVKINQPYTYLYINESGKVVAVSTDAKGNIDTKETTISASNLKENTLVQGPNNEELVITKKGQVMGKEEFNATGGNGILLKEYHRKSDSLAQWQINFSKYDGQTYAFDHIASGDHGIFSSSEYYPQSGSYDFRYKSVECGKSDKVRVEFDTYPQTDSVVFKDKYGVTYPIKDNIISFTGVSKADTNFIYAYRGDQKIGKLFLNTYQKKTYKVVFVRVNGAAKKINEKNLVKYLNKVYKQCAVSFKDSTDEITINELKEFSHGGSGVLTVYNNDQKTVLNAYDKRMKDGVYYLFFVDEVKDKKDGSGTLVSGYMPRGYNCGFIYDGGSERTIAHELGHGIAGLEHVFENSNNSGKTNNLMDYANGDELWHFQWDQIQDPSRVWMKWNKAESEGENVEGKFADYYLFSPWYAEKLFSQQDANILPLTEELKTQLYALTITPMSGDIKSTISQYKKHSDYPQVHLQNFTNYLQQASSLASCVNYIQNTSQYDGLHVWYLLPDGDGYKLTEKMLRAKDNQTDHVIRRTPYDWVSFTKDWDNFWEEWLSVAMEERKNGVFSISFSVDANLYIDENFTTGLKEALSQFGDIKHFSGNGGAYIEGGIAIDQWNVGIYGNLGVFLNGEIEKVSGMVKKLPTYTTYEKVKSMENYCMALGGGICGNFSWFWNFDYLPELYGSGHTKSWTIGPVSGNLFYNRDDERGVFVSGLGFSLGPKDKIPFGFTSLSSENYGYIMTHKEFSDFITWLVKMQNYIEDKRDNPVPMFYIESKLNNSQYIKITKDAAKHYKMDIDEQK